MTSAEAAAAGMVGKVIQHAGEQIAEEHKNVKHELLTLGKDTAYMKDAGNNYAKNIAIRQAIITKMYERMAKWFGLANDYYGGDFNKDMAEKLKDVPEENLVAPKPSLAAPAMQHLGYSLDEPSLKEMYLNLLATASDDRKMDTAHPSFVEVIKQLSANEVKFLESVLTNGSAIPIVRLKVVTEGQEGWILVMSHVVELNEASAEATRTNTAATYVDNWIRLGLVNVDYMSYLTAADAYEWVETSAQMRALRISIQNEPARSVDFDKGMLSPTDFGNLFGRVVGITGN